MLARNWQFSNGTPRYNPEKFAKCRWASANSWFVSSTITVKTTYLREYGGQAWCAVVCPIARCYFFKEQPPKFTLNVCSTISRITNANMISDRNMTRQARVYKCPPMELTTDQTQIYRARQPMPFLGFNVASLAQKCRSDNISRDETL